jgi:uncharacterized membrane protein YqjE
VPEPIPGDLNATVNEGFIRQATLLLASVLAYLRVRLELAGIESKEAAGHWIKLVALLVVGLLLVAFGYLFFCLGGIFLLAELVFGGGNAWIWVTLATATLHLGAGLAVFLRVKSQIAHPVFTATFDEFKKDQAWLEAKTGKRR